MFKLASIVILLFACVEFAKASVGCKIETYGKIVRSGQFDFAKSRLAIKSSNCPDKILHSLRQVLVKKKGPLKSAWFKENYHAQADIVPGHVELVDLDVFLKDRLFPGKKWFFKEVKILGNSQGYFPLDKDESLHVAECSHCHRPGSKTIKVKIANELKGSVRQEWIKGRILVETEALVSKKNLMPHSSPLENGQFETKTVFSEWPEQFFTHRENLKFHKLNKPKRVGDILKSGDLTPIRLVFPGRLAKITLSSGGIKLLSKAMPMQTGRWGENIRLRNMRTKKIIMGRVVDFDKVVVEL